MSDSEQAVEQEDEDEDLILYIGVKLIKAKPMTRLEYNDFRGWSIPVNECGKDEGYLVKYSDDYVSWTPADTFEKSHFEHDGLTNQEIVGEVEKRIAQQVKPS